MKPRLILTARLLQVTAVLLVLFCCRVGNAQDPQRMMTLMQQMQQQIQAGEDLQAAETVTEVMGMAEKVFGVAHPDVIRLGVQRAVLLRDGGELDKALQELKTAAKKATQHLGPDHSVVAMALNVEGTIWRLKGDFEQARVALEKSVQLTERNPASTPKEKAEAYSNFADLLQASGDVALARKYAEQALAMTKKQFGATHPNTALMLNNMGMSLYHLGELDLAEQRLTEALNAYQKIYGPKHGELASSWNNMGLLYVARGKYDQAEKAYQTGLRISHAKLGKDNPTTANLSNGLGQLYGELGKQALAEPLLQQALKFRESALGKDHPSTAITRHNLGCVMLDTQQLAKGRGLLTAAADAHANGSGTNVALAAGSQAFLGMLESLDAKPDAAIAAFQTARQQANDAVWQTLPKLDTNAQQKLMGRTFNWTLFSALSLAEEHPDKATVINATAEWLANGKGIATEALAAARVKEADNNNSSTLAWVKLDEVRAALSADAVLIDIVRQDMIKFDAISYQQRLGDPHYVAWIVPAATNADAQVQRVDLGDAATINGHVAAVRRTVQVAGGPAGKIVNVGEIEATAEAMKALRLLAGKVWQPLADKVDGSKTQRLVLSLDGALWLVPWTALPIGTDNEPKYLIEQFAISTAPSGRSLVSRAANAKEASSADSPAKSNTLGAVFANPLFNQSPDDKRSTFQRIYRRSPKPNNAETRSIAFDTMRADVAPLPGTAVEAAAISPSMTRWLGGQAPKTWQGSEAMESLAKSLRQPRAVVFATHGFFMLPNQKSSIDPLANCGLLLAGCNNRAAAIEGDDGVLTGIEIAQLSLEQTELVVLSACETGIGKIEEGNGVAGLRRAFHLAGAKSVASTLWQIPDFDTAKLMSHFFQSLADGASKDDALQAAQIKRIASRRKRHGAAHPFFWAGFTISGR